MIPFTSKDKQILQILACRVAEHAADPIQDKKRKLWTLHNGLKTDEPLVVIDPENGWKEILPDSALTCTDPTARTWERTLRRRLYYAEHLHDDTVVDDIFNVPMVSSDDGWGVPIVKLGGTNGGAFRIQPAIEEYEETFDRLHFPQISVDAAASDQQMALAHDTFDGILQVRQHSQWWWTQGLTQSFIYLRGFENFLCDFVAEPEWLHKMMDFLCEGTLRQLDWLESQQLLYSNNGNYSVGSGGWGFTDELPDRQGGPCSAMEYWGFVESQETGTISPKMYGEFIFPYHQRIAQRHGLNCYGCCEDFVSRWEYVRQLPRLRRVSCSPWCSRPDAQALLGNQYIASHKLPPMPLASSHMDEAQVRKDLRQVLDHIDGTVPELIMKDNNTLGHCPQNAARWVELAREEIAAT